MLNTCEIIECNSDYSYRHTGQFFLGREPSLPEKFSPSPENCYMLTCKITLPESPHPIIIIPLFRALYLARRNEFRFFRLINQKKYFFHFWLLASAGKISFARKITALPKSEGWSPLARAPMIIAYKMTSHCAGTVQMREESESGIRKWEEMWFKTTAEDGERGGSSGVWWQTPI